MGQIDSRPHRKPEGTNAELPVKGTSSKRSLDFLWIEAGEGHFGAELQG